MRKSLTTLVVVLLTTTGFSQLIEVSDKQGRAMTIEVLGYSEVSGILKIERSDGQVFNTSLDIFDDASQKRIVEMAPKESADLLIRVSVGKRRSRQGDSSYMKDQTVTASITIENDSRDISFPGGKGTLFLVGREMRRYSEDGADYGKVLAKESFQIAVSADETIKVDAKPIVTSYDSDRDSTNVGGFEYYGYLFVLEDENGEVHSVETSIGNLKKDVDDDPSMGKKLLTLQPDSIVKKNLELRLDPFSKVFSQNLAGIAAFFVPDSSGSPLPSSSAP